MLEIDEFKLSELMEALEDNDPETSWWFDPVTGDCRCWIGDFGDDGDDLDPEESGWVFVEPMGSRDGYRDMEDFVALLPVGRVSDLLSRALEGRGAFRRFKDTLFDRPDLRQQWFTFHDTRMKQRAVVWMVDHAALDEAKAETFLAALEQPTVSFVDPEATHQHLVDGVVARAREVVAVAYESGWLGDDDTNQASGLQAAMHRLDGSLQALDVG